MNHLAQLKTYMAGTSTLLLLAVTANAATMIIPGVLKRETWLGGTRAQVESGSLAASNAVVTYPTEWDVVDGTANYASRYSGVVIPATTGLYDFWLAADDDTDLFLSTNNLPAGKRMIAQENEWSGVRNWLSSGAGLASQKSSLTWTNATSGGLAPFAAGIHLVGGTAYYLEGVHHAGGGGNNFAVTMRPHGAGPGDGEVTDLTGTLIGLEITTPTTLAFSIHPSNTTAYVGMPARFRVVTTTDSQIPPRYQWRRGGVEITNATGPTFSFSASTIDNGAQFDCVASVPGFGNPVLTVTSAVAVLTVPASGGVTVAGRLKREVFPGMTQTADGGVRSAVEAGNTGTSATISSVPSLDVPSAGANYGERITGFFTPSVSGRYVLFLAADDDTDLFLSTNDQPSNKQLVAQEIAWSDNRSWNASGGGSSIEQKRSDLWVPDPTAPPATPPYAGGISLTAGTRYYLEAVHRAATGGNGVSATFVLTNEAALGEPADGSATRFTNGVISYVTSPVTTFGITAHPADVTVFEGFNYTFKVAVQTDSEVAPAFQWRKNGTAVTGATTDTYTGLAAFADNNSHFSVDVVIPGVTNTSSTTNTLTVQQGVVAVGQVRREIWTNINSSGVTRAIVEANVPGTFPPADVVTFVSGFDVNAFGQSDYVQRLSGLFTPPVTTNYVFYLASDDDGSLFLGTTDRPESKRRIAFEPNWSNYRSWVSAGNGSAADVMQKCSLTYVDPTTSEPGPGNPEGIRLTAGQRYYMEIVMHQAGGGDPCGATYNFVGETMANGTPSALSGNRVGVLVPAATVLNFTVNPQDVTVVQCQPVFFTAAATNDSIVPSTYQWRRNGTNIPGAVYATTGFITSTNDNGATFDCVATAPAGGLTRTGTVATLTIAPGGAFVVGTLREERWDSPLATRVGIESGSLGYANSNSFRPNVDYGFEGNNFGNRLSGYFLPPVTTNYVFFIASDDDSYLYLSPDDQPSRKVWIAHELGWANARNAWQGAAGGGLNSQKRSDTFTPDDGVTFPGGGPDGGIPLVAGNRYYLEVVHHEGGGGDFLGVTYKFALGDDPVNGDPSILTNSLLAHLEAPAKAVIKATRVGNSLQVSWAPGGGALYTSPLVQGPIWTALSVTNPATIPIGAGMQFLRVQNP
jgi:hypothetical protein